MSQLKEIVYDYPAYYYVGYNLRLPMFSDVRVRHAIDLLMPRDEIIARFISINMRARPRATIRLRRATTITTCRRRPTIRRWQRNY